MNNKLQEQEINNMDLQELLNTLANQVAFWQGRNDRYNAPVVNEARNVIRDTGRVADDFIGGGMGQAALRGPDALTRQLLLNAALTAGAAGVGAGVGKVATQIAPKVSPEIAALRNFLNREDIMIRGMRGPGGELMTLTPPYRVPSSYTMPSVVVPEGFVKQQQSLYSQLGETPVLWGFDPRAKDATASALEYALKHEGTSITRGIETLPSGSTRPGATEITKGTVGIIKVPSGSVSPEPVMPPWNPVRDPKTGIMLDSPEFYRAGGLASTAPGQVVSTVGDISKFNSTPELDAALRRLLKQQGVGTKTEKLLAKVPKKK